MSLSKIAAEVHACTQCSRLRKYCLGIAKTKKRTYLEESYWGKPISGFGDPKAQIVIVGLAPAAHGANTGTIGFGLGVNRVRSERKCCLQVRENQPRSL